MGYRTYKLSKETDKFFAKRGGKVSKEKFLKTIPLCIGLGLLPLWFAPINDVQAQTASTNEASADLANHMIMIDGSNSMWGRVDNIPKMTHVHRAMTEFLRRLDPNVHIGLSAYGHRVPKRCDDIEILQPPKPLNSTHLTKGLKTILPRGRTPLSLALETTAKAMSYQKQVGNILLITDGLENCRRNPCDQVRTLMKQAKNLKIHLVTFGMKEKDAQSLSCIPSLSGGQFFKTTTYTQLQDALNRRAEQINKTAQSRSLYSAKAPPPHTPALAQAPPKVKLQLALSRKGAPLDHNVHWLIYKLTKSGRTPAQTSLVSEEIGPIYQAQLPEGSYEIEARYLSFKVRKPFTLKKNDKIEQNLSLNLGYITMGDLSLPASQLTGTGYATLIPVTKDNKLKAPIHLNGKTKAKPLLVPEGLYLVQVRKNNHISKYQKQITAGTLTKISAFSQMGRVNLTLDQTSFTQEDEAQTPSLNTGAAPMRLTIERFDHQSLHPIVTSIAPLSFYDLEAGRYRITLKQGFASTSTLVKLGKGQVQNLTISLPLAKLKIPRSLTTSINRLNVAKKETDNSDQMPPRTIAVNNSTSPLYFAPGAYKISYYQRGNQNKITQDLDLLKGQTLTLTPPKQGGEFKLNVTKTDRFLEPLIYWHIFGLDGTPIAHGIETSMSVNLPQGSYEIRGRLNQKAFRRQFQINESKQTIVTLSDKSIALTGKQKNNVP